MNERRAVLGVRLGPLDERMARELVAHRLAQHTRAAAVHHSHLAKTGKCGLVDEPSRFEPRLVGRAAPHIDLVGRVATRSGAHLHDRRTFLRRTLA